jgi:hypothetical protein
MSRDEIDQLLKDENNGVAAGPVGIMAAEK